MIVIGQCNGIVDMSHGIVVTHFAELGVVCFFFFYRNYNTHATELTEQKVRFEWIAIIDYSVSLEMFIFLVLILQF